MIQLKKLFLIALIAVGASWNLSLQAQTLAITNGVQKYAALASYTVTMTGRSELWVTNAATPLSGCTINLNSTDAWLFLPNVKPSATVSTYLGQVRVNGASAVADSNCRIVQYGQNGAVVIPQSSSFQPLTVFTGAEFVGTATSYSQWTYYTGAAYTNISSFKLKRGYQAVLAQGAFADGVATPSQCYVAQDGDLEIGVLPSTLSRQVQFIYVTPWRWTSKKGIAGNPPYSDLNVNWWYDWNIDQSSSRDLEYLPIRQHRWDPGLGQNWQSLGANTVLGYNEPDSSSQANIAVGDAVWSWPDVLGTGLRVGSPACTDGGVNSWLLPFMSQANAGGLRVDFVTQHYYQGHSASDASGCASQMYNFLLNIWNNTHRPIWVTEWNNGANWTDSSYAVPTYAQQQACIQAMVNMLESTPFVERYSLYNWVEDNRALITSSNTVTLAGTVYSNAISGLSYSQAMPDNGTRGIAEYLFATNLWDSSGYYNNGMAIGAPAFTTGHNSQASAISLDGTNTYIQLPANIAKATGFTFAAWVYWNGGAAWQRIFDFGGVSTTQGGAPSQYLFLTPSSGGTLRFAINSGGGEQIVQRTGALASGSWQHVALTLSNNVATLYVNGAAVAASNTLTLTPAAFSPIKNYLGKSQFAADPLFNGKLDSVEIADYAMSAAQISVLYNGTQNPNFISSAWTNNASGNWSVSNNWNGGVIANGPSRVADFSTLNVAANQNVTLDAPRAIGGLRFGDLSGPQTWALSGTNLLTLDGGGAGVPFIAVNQNSATLSTALTGTAGFSKSGNGTLVLNSTNLFGGGLTVNAGSLNIAGGSTSFTGTSSSVGYLTGSGSLSVSGGALSLPGELRIGGSDQSGSQYIATGAVSVANSTVTLGSLTVARGNYLDNTISGALTVGSGGTVISTNDAALEFAGTGRGKLALTGGNFILGPTAAKWLMIGYYDTGGGELDITNGNLMLENNTSIKMCRSGNTGGNVVNQIGGNVLFYSDAGVTIGGSGSLDLNYAGAATSTNTYNLNGGILTVPQVIATSANGAGIFNFNGGTLKAAANNTSFMQGLTTVNIRNNGGTIDTAGFNVTIGQALLHSTISGDSSIDGGLRKNGNGTLTLTSSNTYKGNTLINGGTLSLGSGAAVANSRNIVANNGSLFDVSAVSGGFTLGAAQTLSGSGIVNGAFTGNGAISPGAGGTTGTLTFSNPPTLNGNVTLKVARNSGALQNDQLQLPSNVLNFGGALNVLSIGEPPQAGDSFQLFSAAGFSGAFAATNLPSLNPGLAWSNSLAIDGSITVISTASLTPTNLLFNVSDTGLAFSWPDDHIGWRLLMQTNNLDSGFSVNSNDWTTVPNSQFTNQLIVPIDFTLPGEFFRLVFP